MKKHEIYDFQLESIIDALEVMKITQFKNMTEPERRMVERALKYSQNSLDDNCDKQVIIKEV